ncbi:MAG TPA: outer membrane lipid asymmetry maintenance protein MlaD [Burkholderiaceae bacterium]|jgi:phospholipid/cholesterol/gamma-HCH transport system substrate-binding protein|nr:outer membrane lipid asymmetry maintenance protein MlaD [Burkholderiaceae bacterium]
MTKKNMEMMVGLFVVLGIAALVFIALKAANLGSFGDNGGYLLQARFDNIGSLKARAPVRSAGVTVGRVKSIRLDPKTYQGLVTMEIQHGVEFPRDSSAKILTAGLLGDQYVGLEAGGDEKNLAPNDTVTQTQSAVVLENLISQFLFNKAADAGTTAAPAPVQQPAPAGAKK